MNNVGEARLIASIQEWKLDSAEQTIGWRNDYCCHFNPSEQDAEIGFLRDANTMFWVRSTQSDSFLFSQLDHENHPHLDMDGGGGRLADSYAGRDRPYLY